MPHYKHIIILISFALLMTGCTSAAAPSMPAGYSWKQSRVITLEPALEEISGISYEPLLHAFIAINDEKGKVYALDDARLRVVKEFPFAGKGDYEEIVRTDSNWYVLRSDGHLWQMQFNGTGVAGVQEFTYSGKSAEFEAMYWDKPGNRLVLIVKKAKRDTEDKTTYGYAFDIGSKTFSDDPVINIPWSSVAQKANRELKTFHPSAAAVNPLTGELYVLASIEKLLVVLDKNNAVVSVHQLDPAKCLQPEGIAFDAAGNLFISNEADGITPNIIVFTRQSKQR
jgi:uncharacterized protein YjiK